MYCSNGNSRTWSIEKYQRLQDVRNAPIAIEKKNANDLAIYVNMNLKMITVINNTIKLEEFCFSPLIYSHEVICKEVRVLFNVKNQKDGSTNAKFRIRFCTLEVCQDFCSFLSNFMNVLMYEDFQNRNSLNLTTFANNNETLRINESMRTLSRPSSHPSNLNKSINSESYNLNRSFGESSCTGIGLDLNRSLPNAETVDQFSSEFIENFQPSNTELSNYNRSLNESLNVSLNETKSWIEKKEGLFCVKNLTQDTAVQTDEKIDESLCFNASNTTLKNFNSQASSAINITVNSLISDNAMEKFIAVFQNLFNCALNVFSPFLSNLFKNVESLCTEQQLKSNFDPVLAVKTLAKLSSATKSLSELVSNNDKKQIKRQDKFLKKKKSSQNEKLITKVAAKGRVIKEKFSKKKLKQAIITDNQENVNLIEQNMYYNKILPTTLKKKLSTNVINPSLKKKNFLSKERKTNAHYSLRNLTKSNLDKGCKNKKNLKNTVVKKKIAINSVVSEDENFSYNKLIESDNCWY